MSSDEKLTPQPSTHTPAISVVLICKDEPALAQTLDELYPQLLSLGAECIVVDSSSKRLDYIRLARPWLRWIDFKPPVGYKFSIPNQRNTGVLAALAQVVVFADAGSHPTANWLKELTDPILANTYAVTCGPVKSTTPSVYKVINDFPDGTLVESVLTANLAFTRAAFDAVGGFDTRYEYGSDADFAWRLLAAGFPPTSIQKAVMAMDWGTWKLQKRRAWRYGKARARLYAFHPARRFHIINAAPELLVYPALALLALLALLLTLFGLYYAPLLPLLLLVALLLRNAKTGDPFAVLLDHMIYSTSFSLEVAAQLIKKRFGDAPLVQHLPHDRGPYQKDLIQALQAQGASTDFLPSPTASATINLLLLPLTILIQHARGMRILHIHWLHNFELHWGKSKLARRVARLWLAVTLKTAKLCKVPVIWTAHNLLPHTPIFDDDTAARKKLAANCAAVIAHSEQTKLELEDRFQAENITVIPQGVTPPKDLDRDLVRQELSLTPTEPYLLFAGRIERYKGLHLFLTALLAHLRSANSSKLSTPSTPSTPPFTLGLLGEAKDLALKAEVDKLLTDLQSLGMRIIRIDGYLPDQIMSKHLTAADLAIYPFTSITNSGSLLLALAAGTPALAPAHPSLTDLPPEVVTLTPIGDYDAFVKAAITLTTESSAASREFSTSWAALRPWEKVAQETSDLYRKVMEELR